MKKFTLITSLLLAQHILFAQIQIRYADFGSVGDKVFYAYVDSFPTSVNVGASGANQIWNFTSLTPTGYDSALFVDPTTIPDYPLASNIAIVWGETDPDYYKIDTNGVGRIVVQPELGQEIESPPILFPFTFGNTGTEVIDQVIVTTPDELGFPPIFDSIRITIDAIVNLSFDGWGTLNIPSGSHDALRMKTQTITDVLIEGKLFGAWSTVADELDTSYTFTWFGNNKKYYLAEAEADRNGDIFSVKYQVGAVFPNTIRESLQTEDMQLFPNPAEQELHVSIEKAPNGFTYSISELTGRSIRKGHTVSGQATIQTSDLTKGIYLITITTENGKISKPFIVK